MASWQQNQPTARAAARRARMNSGLKAGKLGPLMTPDDLVQRMKSEGRKLAVRFELDAIMDKYERTFRRVVVRKPS